MPPSSIIVIALTRLLRLGFFHASRFVSLAKSLYTLVKTVVGISLKPRDLAVTILAPDWAARKGMAMKMSLLSVVFSGIIPV